MPPSPSLITPHRQAFVDESFQEAPIGGFYVLAAAVFDLPAHDPARAAMLALRAKQGGRAVRKVHWSEMDAQRRRHAAKTVADTFHLVAIGVPVPRRRQERARAMCLRHLVVELHGYGVTELFMESRTPTLDRRDIQTVAGTRFLLPKGVLFRVSHQAGAEEPLFWGADIVAGAVRAHYEGDPESRLLLKERLYEIQVDTGC
ncbi:MAG: hypothetical protein ACRDQ7_22320 [Haloechinothrix sp.]